MKVAEGLWEEERDSRSGSYRSESVDRNRIQCIHNKSCHYVSSTFNEKRESYENFV